MEKLENSVQIIERFDCPGGKLKRIYLENFDGNLSAEQEKHLNTYIVKTATMPPENKGILGNEM